MTGQRAYTAEFVDIEKNANGNEKKATNIGRLALVYYKDTVTYVSLSEDKPDGRNSYFQSFPSAMVRYLKEANSLKKLAFYFLPNKTGNSIETEYHIMMYRLMATIGTNFLNADFTLDNEIKKFISVTDFINYRTNVLSRKQNNSSYVTIDEDGNSVIYGKVYGASKKETTLITLAMRAITSTKTILYQFVEKDLKALPALDLEILDLMDVQVIKTDRELEKHELFEKSENLRLPSYIANLLEKLGPKKCAFCNCDLPQLIEGAHIFPVASIKKMDINQDEKLALATDKDNGLWLCNNHHKMLDRGIITISENGAVLISKMLIEPSSAQFVNDSIVHTQISKELLTEPFIFFVKKRLQSA